MCQRREKDEGENVLREDGGGRGVGVEEGEERERREGGGSGGGGKGEYREAQRLVE